MDEILTILSTLPGNSCSVVELRKKLADMPPAGRNLKSLLTAGNLRFLDRLKSTFDNVFIRHMFCSIRNMSFLFTGFCHVLDVKMPANGAPQVCIRVYTQHVSNVHLFFQSHDDSGDMVVRLMQEIMIGIRKKKVKISQKRKFRMQNLGRSGR